MMTRPFVFDIDSTLYDEKRASFPEDAIKALTKLQELGHTVIIATGRAPFRARQIYTAGIHPDYLITNNGHCILDEEGNVLYEHRVSLALAEEVTNYAEQHGLGLSWSYPDKFHVYYRTPALNPIIARNAQAHICLGYCGIHRKTAPLGGCLAANKEELEQFRSHFKSQISVTSINSVYGDLVLEGESKWNSLCRLSEKLGFRTEDCIAFGDNMNDAEMITNCGIGVSMGNGTPELKAIADYITTDVDKSGIVNALKHFGILED